MQTITLREITRRLGISPDDQVAYHEQGNKGIIEIDLDNKERNHEETHERDHDLEILNRNSEYLNEEAADVLEYQVNL